MSDIEDLYDENDLELLVENEPEELEPPSGGIEVENANDEEGAPAVVKPKKVVRNPLVKLDAEKLKGVRGLSALESYFDRVKFKGKGYEEQDLSTILKTYEYWCHRLFPRHPFDDCIAKIEKLGNTRAVVTHIKKIRYNLVQEDIIPNDVIEDNEEPVVDQFDDLVDIPVATQPPREISEEEMEQIRLNKERAERIRRERMRSRELEAMNQENREPSPSPSLDLEVSQPLDVPSTSSILNEESTPRRRVRALVSDSDED